jgi:hypothetical protein
MTSHTIKRLNHIRPLGFSNPVDCPAADPRAGAVAYSRTPIGAKVIVFATGKPAAAGQ